MGGWLRYWLDILGLQVVREQLGLDEAAKQKHYGLLAEFPSAAAVFKACERVRDAGYTKWDSHTPFPVHGLDKAMGLKDSRVPWVALILGLSGAATGFIGQTWVHGGVPQGVYDLMPSGLAAWIQGWEYPLVISGKPLWAWPTYIPITFELGVLSAAFGAVIAMLLFNQLPRWYHSLFNSERFARVTDDAFFIAIEAIDPKFDAKETARLLEEVGAVHVEMVAR